MLNPGKDFTEDLIWTRKICQFFFFFFAVFSICPFSSCLEKDKELNVAFHADKNPEFLSALILPVFSQCHLTTLSQAGTKTPALR